jgi:hypothetical protein
MAGVMKNISHGPEMADVALATTAISSPFWLEAVANGLHLYIAVGGAILLTFRVIKAIKDCRKGK